jgi:8-oxo-dGTP diphosphatase
MPKPEQYNISLKCFLHNSKWEVLILKTPENSSFYGMYDFPGGRIDEDEFKTDYIEILKRELYEEAWVENIEIEKKVVAIARHKAEGKFTSKNISEYLYYNFFEAFLLENQEIKISHEHQEYLWVKLDEIILEDYFYSWYLEAAKMYLNK